MVAPGSTSIVWSLSREARESKCKKRSPGAQYSLQAPEKQNSQGPGLKRVETTLSFNQVISSQVCDLDVEASVVLDAIEPSEILQPKTANLRIRLLPISETLRMPGLLFGWEA